MTDDRFDQAREAMIEWQIAKRGIKDPAILDAFRNIPRELFVADDLSHRAYSDRPLPIAAAQTISQPYIVALMIATADIGPDSNVLEVGSGSGYATAVIAQIADHVVGIERIAELGEEAKARLEALRIGNAEIVVGDGSKGWPDKAPYDAIIVSATAPDVPRALTDQLAEGGRLVIPVGTPPFGERLLRIERHGEELHRRAICGVRFVPLIED